MGHTYCRYAHQKNNQAIESRSYKNQNIWWSNGQRRSDKKTYCPIFRTNARSELTEHLAYEKYSLTGKNNCNSRNGKTHKSLKNDPLAYSGEIEIAVPRDRNGEFDPIIIKKYEKTIGPIENKIISMYAKGMTTRDIQSHITKLFGIDISPTLVSNITDKIVVLAEQWQNRILEKKYPIVFFNAINNKVRDESRKVISKAAYTCLAVDIEGHKDFLVYGSVKQKETTFGWAF